MPIRHTRSVRTDPLADALGVDPDERAPTDSLPREQWGLWPEGLNYDPVREAARGVISILIGEPLPSTRSVQAMRAPGMREATDTLSYEALDEVFAFGGWGQGSVTRHSKLRPPKTAAARRRRSLRNAEASPRQSAGTVTGKMQPDGNSPKRRKTRHEGRPSMRAKELAERGMLVATDATREAFERLGKPILDIRDDGARLIVWEVDPAGDGAVCARMSGSEAQGGETGIAQIETVMHTVKQCNKRPRYVLLSTENSGTRKFENRLDLVWLRNAIIAGDVRWTAWRETGRIAREAMPLETFFELTRDAEIELIITEMDGLVDFNSDNDEDRLILNGMLDRKERKRLVKKLAASRFYRRIANGEVAGGAERYGMYYDKRENRTKYDPEAWPYIRAVHLGYEWGFQATGHCSLAEIRRLLAELGCRLGDDAIARILTDPFYLDGSYTNGWRGRRVTTKGVEIPAHERIDPAMFQRNKERYLVNRAKHTRRPLGYHALNSITVLHGRCMDEVIWSEPKTEGKAIKPQQPHLKARERSGKYAGSGSFITHLPKVPDCCRGFKISYTELEAAVMSGLRQIARNHVLLDEWRQRAAAVNGRAETEPETSEPDRQPNGAFTHEKRAELEARLEAMEVELAKFEDDASNPHTYGTEAWLSDDEYSDKLKRRRSAIAKLAQQLRADERIVPNLPNLPQLSPELRGLARAAELSDEATASRLADVLDEILTDERPHDTDHMRKRAAVLATCLERVVVYEVEDGFEIELHGPLVPPAAEIGGNVGPTTTAAEILEQCARGEHLEGADGTLRSRPLDAVHTVGTPVAGQTVWTRYGKPIEVLDYRDIRGLAWDPPKDPKAKDRKKIRMRSACHHMRWTEWRRKQEGVSSWVNVWSSPRLSMAALVAGRPLADCAFEGTSSRGSSPVDCQSAVAR